MGAWGAGSFENDSALDFVHAITDATEGLGDEDEPGKLALVFGCLVKVSGHKGEDDPEIEDDELDEDELDNEPDGEFLDLDEGCAAIVSAEVVAAIAGRPHADFVASGEAEEDDALATLAAWCKQDGEDQHTLASKQAIEFALAAIDRVLNDEASESRDLWAESDSFDEWQHEMENLQDRLKACLPGAHELETD